MNSSSWLLKINDAISHRIKERIYRKREVIDRGNNRLLYYKGKSYLNFSSNDYLGLSKHPKVIEAWRNGGIDFGIGSGGSAHVIGYSFYHQKLEKNLANWLGFQRALLFTSGFVANQAVILTLTSCKDHIFADRLSHASLLEAAIQSKARLHRFIHNDLCFLKNLIKRDYLGNRLIVTEGVFSMNGDQAPLEELIKIKQETKSWLMVDDAHGIGVIGEEGRGCTYGLSSQPDLLVVTFGKAIGVNGAAVLCNDLVAEYLVQFSSHLIYTTSLPPAQIAAIDTSLMIIRQDNELRDRLSKNIIRFRKGVSQLNYTVMPSNTPIQPLIIGDTSRTIQIAKILRKRGIWLSAIRPPTVPSGSARLRITITADHKPSDIDLLLEILSDIQNNV